MLFVCSVRPGSENLTAPLAPHLLPEVCRQGLYTSTELMDRRRDQRRGGLAAPVGTPGRLHRTEPNAPAGDPPARVRDEQTSPSQPAG